MILLYNPNDKFSIMFFYLLKFPLKKKLKLLPLSHRHEKVQFISYFTCEHKQFADSHHRSLHAHKPSVK